MPRPRGKDGLYHRVVVGGIYACGLRERDGYRGATMARLVTCAACKAFIAERRAAAKARAPQ